MDQLPVGIVARGAKPPKFERATCKGSFALGSACGHCERCDWERSLLDKSKIDGALGYPETLDATFLALLQARLGKLMFCRDCGDFVGYRVNQRQIICTRAAHPVASFSE